MDTYRSQFNPSKVQHKTIVRLLITSLFALVLVLAVLYLTLKLFPYTVELPIEKETVEGAKTIEWSLLEGITGVVTMALVIGGLLFALPEYTQNTIQHEREGAEASFNIYKEVFDRMMNEEDIAARRWIIKTLPLPPDEGEDYNSYIQQVTTLLDENPKRWWRKKGERPPGREHLKTVLNTFDFVGFVAAHYWSMEDELVEWMSPSIAKVWERVRLSVEDEAARRNEPDFYKSARQFGDYCIEWRQNRYPDSNIIDDAT